MASVQLWENTWKVFNVSVKVFSVLLMQNTKNLKDFIRNAFSNKIFEYLIKTYWNYLECSCPGCNFAAARQTLFCLQHCSLKASLLMLRPIPAAVQSSGNKGTARKTLTLSYLPEFCGSFKRVINFIITRSPFLWGSPAGVLWDKVWSKPLCGWAASFFLKDRWACSLVTQM